MVVTVALEAQQLWAWLQYRHQRGNQVVPEQTEIYTELAVVEQLQVKMLRLKQVETAQPEL
jgi:hypothetical protein